MGHIEGASRVHQRLFPEALDDSMAEDNAVCVIAALVDRVDLDTLGLQRTEPAPTGRPSSSPGDFLTRYIYGDMHRLRSGRRLEKATHRNVALLWLLRQRPPDVKPMADFRKDKAQAFKQGVRAFVLLCKAWGRFGQELVAIDGSKFKAVKSKRRNFTPAKLNETLKRSDAPIAQSLHNLDTADTEEAERQKTPAEERQAKSRHRRERQGRDQGLRRELEVTGQRQGSWTAPDRRSRPKRPTVDVGYTGQGAVDATHQLGVVHAVTKAVPDGDQLRGIAIQAKAAVEVDQIHVVAEMGY